MKANHKTQAGKYYNLLAITTTILLLVTNAITIKAEAVYEFQNATSVVTTPANKVYVTGYKNLFGTNTEIVTQVYTNKGTLINEVVNKNNNAELHNDQPYKVLADANNNIYVCGHEFIDDLFGYEVVLIKYDENLNQLWKMVLYTSEHYADEARGIAIDGLGNICITGIQRHFENFSKVFLYKINPAGEVVYYSNLPNDFDNKIEMVNNLIADKDGNVIICGTASNPLRATRFFTAKFDVAGALKWKRFNDCTTEKFNDEAFALSFDKWGNILVAGSSEISFDNAVPMVVKYNPDGILTWCKTLPSETSGRAGAWELLSDKQGNIFVVSFFNSAKFINDHFYAYKLNSFGTQQWMRSLPGVFNHTTLVADSLLFIAGSNATNEATLTIISTLHGIKKGVYNKSEIHGDSKSTRFSTYQSMTYNAETNTIVLCGKTENCGQMNYCESNWLVSFYPQDMEFSGNLNLKISETKN
ncbi:MAG: hypothetical protein JNK61_08285 [Bacteroidia bacterium]|nr:hypothetical protein [Bacteroidia bacterium]